MGINEATLSITRKCQYRHLVSDILKFLLLRAEQHGVVLALSRFYEEVSKCSRHYHSYYPVVMKHDVGGGRGGARIF